MDRVVARVPRASSTVRREVSLMSPESKTSRRRVIGMSAAAAAGLVAATAGIIGYTRRHRHLEGEMPAGGKMPVEHGE